ncbi:hypothetical protein FKM82_011293 [Ascaphus truei]
MRLWALFSFPFLHGCLWGGILPWMQQPPHHFDLAFWHQQYYLCGQSSLDWTFINFWYCTSFRVYIYSQQFPLILCWGWNF